MTLDMGNRAQMAGNTNRILAVVLAVALMAILGAFLGPVALDALNQDRSVTINQTTSSTEEVHARLNATLDSVDTTNDDATITLTYDDGSSETNTVSNGTTTTYTVNGFDVNVTVNNVETGYAEATYDFPQDMAYSDGARGLWGLVGLTVVLALFLAILYKGMEMTGMRT